MAKYLVWLKNFIAPPNQTFCLDDVHDAGNFSLVAWGDVQPKYQWENCKATGYPSETPAFLAVWLMIFADNILHLTINYLALKYL